MKLEFDICDDNKVFTNEELNTFEEITKSKTYYKEGDIVLIVREQMRCRDGNNNPFAISSSSDECTRSWILCRVTKEEDVIALCKPDDEGERPNKVILGLEVIQYSPLQNSPNSIYPIKPIDKNDIYGLYINWHADSYVNEKLRSKDDRIYLYAYAKFRCVNSNNTKVMSFMDLVDIEVPVIRTAPTNLLLDENNNIIGIIVDKDWRD